ncbi:hypothetical protein D9M68_917150 [compost metagenome]
MEDIAHNYNFLSCYSAQFLTNGKSIQQGLGRMLMGAISGVHNLCFYMLTEKYACTGIGVPHHHHVDLHGKNVVDGINEGFSFTN